MIALFAGGPASGEYRHYNYPSSPLTLDILTPRVDGGSNTHAYRVVAELLKFGADKTYIYAYTLDPLIALILLEKMVPVKIQAEHGSRHTFTMYEDGYRWVMSPSWFYALMSLLGTTAQPDEILIFGLPVSIDNNAGFPAIPKRGMVDHED